MKKHFIIPIFVPHKGCPHDCVFCNQKRITGQGSFVDSAFVENEISKLLGTIPTSDRVVEVSFYGGSFTGLPVQEQICLLKPAKKALDNGSIDAIRLSTRPDYIDRYILETLKHYGVSIIELGVQSMDDNVLKLSNRGHTAADVYRASDLIKDYGFILGLQMMVGLPGDCKERDLKTADEFIKINPRMVRVYPALVIKETYMEDMYRKNQYTPLTVDEAVDICSELYLKFEGAHIKIIRMGLQPTENITYGKDIVSGPFHPAFRELVESKIINDIIKYLYKKQENEIMNFHVNERTISKIYADKKKYFNIMLNEIRPGNVNIIRDNNVPFNSIEMSHDKNSLIMSIKDYSLTI